MYQNLHLLQPSSLASRNVMAVSLPGGFKAVIGAHGVVPEELPALCVVGPGICNQTAISTMSSFFDREFFLLLVSALSIFTTHVSETG